MNRVWAFVFFGAGVAVFFYGLRLVRDARNSANWPKVQGNILSAEIQQVSREKDKATYAPNVTYSYTVEGKRYESSRLTLVPRNYPTRQSAQSIIAQYQVGSAVSVFHDPKDPANCLLVTTSNGSEWAYPIGGLIFIGLGFLFLKRD